MELQLSFYKYLFLFFTFSLRTVESTLLETFAGPTANGIYSPSGLNKNIFATRCFKIVMLRGPWRPVPIHALMMMMMHPL